MKPRMSASAREGVVDARGLVHGLTGLRIVCTAIMPRVTTGNLSAPTYMIAEKLADEIRGVTPFRPQSRDTAKEQ